MQFDEALRYLLGLGHETLAIKLGLRNTELLLAARGNPHKAYPAVQIAGTNGKGSTAVVLNSICQAAGIKTGLYTSPHLVSITERIKVEQKKISESDFAGEATAVRDAAEKLDALPTFFEHVTAIAFSAFKNSNIDLAILETGLGGRLDATSVAQAEVVGITPIALDHEEYLGRTIESIAAEKAAIIRPGSTAVIAPQSPEVLEVILREAGRSGVQPILDSCHATIETVTKDGRFQVTFETEHNRYEHVLIGLRGRHQIVNVSLAIRLAESLVAKGFTIQADAIREGIDRAHHAGRLEIWPGNHSFQSDSSEETLKVVAGNHSFLFDGAHNPAGTRALREYLEEFVDDPVTLVFGVMRDKAIGEMAANLFPVAQHVVLTTVDNPRTATPDEILNATKSHMLPERISSTSSVKAAIAKAYTITPSHGLICFAGSLYLIGEAQSVLLEAKAAGAAQKSH